MVIRILRYIPTSHNAHFDILNAKLKQRLKMNIEALTQDMNSEISASDELFQPSHFWNDINKRNLDMVKSEGLQNFKRTVSQNYFNWLIADENHPYHQFVRKQENAFLLRHLSSLNEMDHLRLTDHAGQVKISIEQRESYRKYVCHVWAIMQKYDKHRIRRIVDEPEIGNPFPINYLGKRLSQDLATSILECNTLFDLNPQSGLYKVAEIGAGYGRLANVFTRASKGLYCIFDITPALAISQWYAQECFGLQNIFGFRHFNDFGEIACELERSRIAFFTPNQIVKFPDGFFNTIVTISTLPEMRMDQVEFYIKEFQRLSSSSIYIKQWKSWKNPVDQTDITQDSYVLDDIWGLHSEWNDPIIPDFFNRVWQKI